MKTLTAFFAALVFATLGQTFVVAAQPDLGAWAPTVWVLLAAEVGVPSRAPWILKGVLAFVVGIGAYFAASFVDPRPTLAAPHVVAMAVAAIVAAGALRRQKCERPGCDGTSRRLQRCGAEGCPNGTALLCPSCRDPRASSCADCERVEHQLALLRTPRKRSEQTFTTITGRPVRPGDVLEECPACGAVVERSLFERLDGWCPSTDCEISHNKRPSNVRTT